MAKVFDQIDDTTLHGLDAASCCTCCARHVLAGAGVQIVDAQGRVHRHCARCHSELMTPAPKHLSPQLGGTDPGPGAGRGPDLPASSPLPGLSPADGCEVSRSASRPGGASLGKEQA